MKRIIHVLLVSLFVLPSTIVKPQEDKLMEEANKLAQEFMIVDTHIDVLERLKDKWEDISERTESGNFDFIRANKGGLNVPFMAIFVAAEYENNGAKAVADSLIDMMESIVKNHPDKFAIPYSVKDVMKIFESKKMAFAFGMENGAPIEGDLNNVKYFYDRGIRYITLTHSKANHICDSSYDPDHKWNGLSPFGKKLIEEMNRLGIMVDISHVSDSAFYQALRISRAPIIASHSSCRFYTPGWERNMSDEMIKALAEKGGVIQINFGSDFLKQSINEKHSKERELFNKYLTENNLQWGDKQAEEFIQNYRKENPNEYADVTDAVDHIDHVVKLAGIDHVGIGSDYDGVGDSLPTGLKDVSGYPNIIYHLLKRGYSKTDIQKICSGNILRVWSDVEKIAADLQN